MEIKSILFLKMCRDDLLAHCRRKLAEDYLPDEKHERKAYGLVGGQRHGGQMVVAKIFPLRKNVRKDDQYDEEMTKAMYAHGIASKTPFERRGWVADPKELYDIYQEADQLGLELFGNYHMHLVPWPPDDPIRDTPTGIDTVLAKDSNMTTFIISMVDPDKPVIRAFYESKLAEEIPITFMEEG